MTAKLPGYTIFNEVSLDPKFVAFKGIREEDQLPVLIKTTNTAHPQIEDVSRLKNEYEILKNENIPNVIKAFGLENYHNSFYLILEDFQGVTLDKVGRFQKLDMISSLKIAIQIVNAIKILHEHQIIHKDIQPKNILVNTQSLEVKLTGFGVATRLLRQKLPVKSPNLLDGTLAYISPEQTGRMNREVDYRSDLYSLGVTFYEFFTRILPFKSKDPMELVHAHIAKTPIAPHKVDPTVPEAVSDIILKLMSKTAEDRYSNIQSLIDDLEECLHQVEETGRIVKFPLGKKDIFHKLQVTQKIYGRDKELKTLLQTFDEVSGGATQLMLVSGYSGIGKSSVVNEIHKPIVAKKGFFISGKFDQYKINIPYSAFIQAFQDLIQQILTEKEEIIQMWKTQILVSLGPNGRIITDVIPELKLIIGEQPPVPELDLQETQNRFTLYFQKFIATFANIDTPLVIFIDDLQWVDAASLKLIELLTTTLNTKGLFLIGAYRNNEVSKLHPLMLTVSRIYENGGKISNIELPPLEFKYVNFIIAESLQLTPDETLPLAEVVQEKTQGNPFFINQLLNYLYEKDYLVFDSEKMRWTWDLEAIKESKVSENVVDLLVDKLVECSQQTQDTLKLAACVGNMFEINMLAKIANLPSGMIIRNLTEALKEGFIIPTGDVNSYFWDETYALRDLINPTGVPLTFRFMHDRVQQAAYSMLSEEEKADTHLKIGRILLQKKDPEDPEKNLFDIMNNINSAENLITETDERLRFAKMNADAAQKAMHSVAYGTALGFLEMGQKFLPEEKWNSHHDLSFKMGMNAAECTYLLGNNEEAANLFNELKQFTRNDDERFQIYSMMVKLYISTAAYREAIISGREALKLVGSYLPEKNLKLHVLKEFFLTKWMLYRTKIDNLVYLPVVTEPHKVELINLLATLITPAYLSDKDLFAYIVLHGVRMSIKYGNASLSPYIFASYGIILNAIFKDFKNSYKIGNVALDLCEKLPDRKALASTTFLYATFLTHTQKHLSTVLEKCAKGYELAVSMGDLISAVFCLGQMSNIKFIIGENIAEQDKHLQEYFEFVKKFKAHNRGYIILTLHQTIKALRGQTISPTSMTDEDLNEEHYFKLLKDNNFLITMHFTYTHKMRLCVHFEDYAQAVKVAEIAKEIEFSVMGQTMRLENYFLYALALAGDYPNVDLKQQNNYLNKMLEIHKELSAWAKAAPENYLHKALLVQAELARLKGNKDEAIESYDKAIESAKENNFIQNEALANELFAKYYLSINKQQLAKQYLLEAQYGYYRWGASAKIANLQQKYPKFFAGSNRLLEESSTFRKGVPAAEYIPEHGDVDLVAVVKATQAISSEIVLEKLLTQLMKVAIENAGAEKAALVLERDTKWVVEAEQDSEGNSQQLKSVPLMQKSQELSTAVINYVIRTKENVVLDNASKEDLFNSDPYIRTNHTQSVLCLPLIHQSQLVGVLYLENNLTSGAFHPELVESMRLLTNQIATSLENSILYSNLSKLSNDLTLSNEKLEDYTQNLERKVYDRTRELKEKNKQLEETISQINDMQRKLIKQEKFVSLGAATKTIATKIRNPLNYIYNFASLTTDLLHDLEQSKNTTEQKELCNVMETNLKKIYEHSQKADEIISSMLKSSQEFEELREPTDINKLIRDYADLVYHTYYKKDPLFSLTIEISYDESIGKINVVPQNMGRVFYNIIENACYATDQKKKELGEAYSPVLSITSKNAEDHVIIKIRDNGNGIPPDILNRIFTPFVTTKPSGQSAGMGLSISHEIVSNEHGGKISVDSELGKFTEVTIILPKI